MILVFGTVCIDRLRRVPDLPPPGGYAEITDEHILLGGEAANTANALNTWSDALRLVGNPLGIDPEGEMLRSLLDRKGLKVDEYIRDGFAGPLLAPVCDIYVTPDGERTMFGRGFRRSGKPLDLKLIPFERDEWFTAEPNMESESREATRAAKAAGMKIYLMDFVKADDPIFEGSFWQSSTDWAGHRNNVQRNVRWVKDFVSDRGCFCILSDGPNGFVAGSPDLPVQAYPPFPAYEVIDTTGAGDLFRAGMLHGLSRGWPIPDCLRFASAAGCLKCRYLGATTHVPSDEDIQRHIVENPDVARFYGG